MYDLHVFAELVKVILNSSPTLLPYLSAPIYYLVFERTTVSKPFQSVPFLKSFLDRQRIAMPLAAYCIAFISMLLVYNGIYKAYSLVTADKCVDCLLQERLLFGNVTHSVF